MEEEALQQAAMMDMMGGGGAPPMDPMAMDPAAGEDPFAIEMVPVPLFAVPAVVELVAMLEDEMMGGGGGEMPM